MWIISKSLCKIFVYSMRASVLSMILCGLLVASVFADSEGDILQAGRWELMAKPRICVTPAIRRVCTMSTDLIWTGTVSADICLLSSQAQEAIQCWQNMRKGDLVQDIASEVPITYRLTHFGEDKVLTETTIRIITVPQRQIRRRRRHIWSLL